LPTDAALFENHTKTGRPKSRPLDFLEKPLTKRARNLLHSEHAVTVAKEIRCSEIRTGEVSPVAAKLTLALHATSIGPFFGFTGGAFTLMPITTSAPVVFAGCATTIEVAALKSEGRHASE
jgi:hypothetical protein